jgi:tRNA(Ile)-lysidine synthase
VKRLSITSSVELLRRGDEWVLRQKPEPAKTFELEMRAGEAVYVPEIGKTIRITRHPAPGTRQRFQLPTNSDALFTIRNRRDGDRFQPLGMRREKKLKDFLIDRKIAHEIRDRIPLLVWSGKIVCVAGVEISEAFKVTGGGELYEVAIEEANQEGVQREADRPAGQ